MTTTSSEYMFGVTHARVSAREAKRRDRICREEGGYGYTWLTEAGRYTAWYSGPNLGHPFDGDLERRVLAREVRS